jgi:hypothetical protein
MEFNINSDPNDKPKIVRILGDKDTVAEIWEMVQGMVHVKQLINDALNRESIDN